MRSSETEQQARRFVEICNACRYCEGYCAVFPAIELRRQFTSGDLSYLANLCHDCRGCYYSCQYAPPHEFALNLPRVLAELRLETYERYAWPRPLAALFRRNGIAVSILTFLSIAFFLWLAKPESSSATAPAGPGGFYAVVPEVADGRHHRHRISFCASGAGYGPRQLLARNGRPRGARWAIILSRAGRCSHASQSRRRRIWLQQSRRIFLPIAPLLPSRAVLRICSVLRFHLCRRRIRTYPRPAFALSRSSVCPFFWAWRVASPC